MFKILQQLMAPEGEETGGGEAAATGGEENQGTALDAINEALGHTEEPGDDAANTGAEGEDGAAAAGDEGEAAAGDAEGEQTDQPAADETAERDPVTGRFRKKDPAAEAEAAAADAAAAAAAKDGKGGKPGEQKAPDPINDPIPKDLAPKTQERMRTLIKTTKELTAARDEAVQNFDFLVQGVQSTGATPEQYGETLSWLKLFNSGDPAQQEKALELVETVAERLATMLGKERRVADPLAAHADLQDSVQKGKITPEYAREIARTRQKQHFTQELTTAQRQEQQQQEQQQQAIAQAKLDLDTVEKDLKANDPHYAAKRAQLVPILKPLFQTIHPSKWAASFQEAYRRMQFTPAARPKPVVPANQPLRANKSAPAGGQNKAPGSALDAINAALNGMNG